MESHQENHEQQGQQICDKLGENDPKDPLLNVDLSILSSEEVECIFAATRRNTTIKNLRIHSGTLSVLAAQELYRAVVQHPTINDLSFENVIFREFSAITLAIRHNDKLSNLTLRDCSAQSSNDFSDNLQILLRTRALESLAIHRFMNFGPSFPIFVFRGLESDCTLKRLTINTRSSWGFGLTDDTLRLPSMITANQAIQTLDLFMVNLSSPLMERIAQAAEGHRSLTELILTCGSMRETAAAAIGRMLCGTPTLRYLGLSRCSMGPTCAHHISEGLRDENCALERLEFRGNNIRDEGAIDLGDALKINKTLKSLALSNNHITKVGAAAIAEGLKNNSSVDQIDLHGNIFCPEGVAAIADALCSNSSVERITLQDNHMRDDGAVSVGEMLTKNESIERIIVGDFGERGFNALVDRLPHMIGIKVLECRSVLGFTTGNCNAFVDALGKNYTLETVELYDPYAYESNRGMDGEFNERHHVVPRAARQPNDNEEDENDDDNDDDSGILPPHMEIMPRVNQLLALNRAGRRLIKSSSTVPKGLWPYILGNSSTDVDVLFCFLREIPNTLVIGSSTCVGKRKREEGGKWSVFNEIWSSTLAAFGLSKRRRVY